MDELLEHCRQSGLRVTISLRTILDILQSAATPQSLSDLENDPRTSGLCDRATIFRTLQRLEAIGMLRRLNFSRSGAKFSLNTGSSHKEYLICRECGVVRELAISCPVQALEQRLIEEEGFVQMSHELTFYGLCGPCAGLEKTPA